MLGGRESRNRLETLSQLCFSLRHGKRENPERVSVKGNYHTYKRREHGTPWCVRMDRRPPKAQCRKEH